ncbi:MAG: SMC-Scp complex subunit ScpB [Clostridia bacterium]|nr:SMC-Scp complex subunit ScpB [Clostridia bacterium]
MEIREIQSILEAVLFAAGDAVELEKLADIVDVDKKSLREILKKMMDSYNFERRGVHIIQMEDSYQMCTRGEYHDYVAMLAEPRRKQSLSNAAIEVLAIVAYKQPVTRSTIEHIRGVNCDYVVNRLMERNLIEEKGRLDAPGRPILFGTTQEFLRCFGVATLQDLPEFESFGSPEGEGEQLSMELGAEQIGMMPPQEEEPVEDADASQMKE